MCPKINLLVKDLSSYAKSVSSMSYLALMLPSGTSFLPCEQLCKCGISCRNSVRPSVCHMRVFVF